MIDMDILTRESIEHTRIEDLDNNVVIYDLSSDIDFSNPRDVGKSLSEVFFDKDGSKWFKQRDGKLKFDPDYRVIIKIPHEESREVDLAIDYFFYNLEKVELPNKFSKEMKKVSGYLTGFPGLARAAYADSMKNYMKENIEIQRI